jgi:NitT/TauT family transport system permease protein
MTHRDTNLAETLPAFDDDTGRHEVGLSGMSSLASSNTIRSWRDALVILLVAVVIIGGLQVWLTVNDTPSYVMPKPSAIGLALWDNFDLFWPHILSTLQVLVIGYAIGAMAGLVLAATITQVPFVEKVITPYILLLVTTPMLALVPLLSAKLGYDSISPRIIVVALASGPMVMINAATGFRRTDLGKIALARSYGASTVQLFTKVRFPMALPMIVVGLMIGAIFGLLTAVGAEMVGGGFGLGNRLTSYSSMIQMPQFFAVVLILSILGILIYVLFFLLGKKFASWEA